MQPLSKSFSFGLSPATSLNWIESQEINFDSLPDKGKDELFILVKHFQHFQPVEGTS